MRELASMLLRSLLAWLCLGIAGCSGFDNAKSNRVFQISDAGTNVADGGTLDLACAPIKGQPLPARLVVMSEDAGSSSGTPVFVDDLFNRFNSSCGGCHVSQNIGNLQLNRTTFASLASQLMLDRMNSDDPNKVMPPPPQGKPVSQRRDDDPVSQLASLVQAWFAAGKPKDVFYLAADPSSSSNPDKYLLRPETGATMSNIGDCIPNRLSIATSQSKMDQLDTFFAGLNPLPAGQGTLSERIGLPPKLEQTDLFTLDTKILAKHGVIAYVPTYPLWTDDSGKWRMVRVPRGQSIAFDKASQSFNIPPNTRFYKTFLKEIVDVDGVRRFKKIETRVIVVRPDTQASDGTFQPHSLFGTYAWNEEETEASLVTDPLHNGEPFGDRLITYITDEPAATAVKATNPSNLSYALQRKQLTRHYAIPGSARCVDCHEGSPNHSFILGFTPLQAKRRPTGEGGVLEPTTADELAQLQRLIGYKVISGIETPNDILNLEDSQGARKPRNEYELKAQGYMVGNCSHCHNPHGDPSNDNPELAHILNFLPGPDGGIFQFPLDRMSPRISRGPGGPIPIPYITPSLMDYPVENDRGYTFWTPKADADGLWPLKPYIPLSTITSAPGKPRAVVFAPWRSLIFRNVDTPFAYSDNFALFPHMPKNSPGHDFRAGQILADWMVSIPARRKHTNLWEYGVPFGQEDECGTPDQCDTEAQPYVEVLPGDSDYQTALDEANQRLDIYHTGQPPWQPPWYGPFPNRYTYRPDTSDIVDMSVFYTDPSACSAQITPAAGAVWTQDNSRLIMPNVGVPLKAHWVDTDLTDIPGDWFPRRLDWLDVVANQKFPPLVGDNCNNALQRQLQEKQVVKALQNVRLTSAIRDYALTPMPFGLWQNKAGCKLSSEPTVAQVQASAKPARWIGQVNPPPDSRVYTQLPGAAVFNMICQNCHGPQGDSHGRMADNLLTMTGGTVRVANLRDGLFGPVSIGSNRPRVFGGDATKLGISPDDLAARYLSWMALGGTKAQIAPSILNIVGNTQVLGAFRKANIFESVTAASANMLATAQELCRNVIPWVGGFDHTQFYPTSGTFDYSHSALILTNGDAEMWQNLCSIDNSPPIRALIAEKWLGGTVNFMLWPYKSLYHAEGYPANSPVGNQSGLISASLTPDNTMPWCIVAPSAPDELVVAQQYVIDHAIGGSPLPFCPQSLLTGGYQMLQDLPGSGGSNSQLQDWATRGAINAGMAVFLYLDQVVAHGLKPKPSYDQCEQLQN